MKQILEKNILKIGVSLILKSRIRLLVALAVVMINIIPLQANGTQKHLKLTNIGNYFEKSPAYYYPNLISESKKPNQPNYVEVAKMMYDEPFFYFNGVPTPHGGTIEICQHDTSFLDHYNYHVNDDPVHSVDCDIDHDLDDQIVGTYASYRRYRLDLPTNGIFEVSTSVYYTVYDPPLRVYYDHFYIKVVGGSTISASDTTICDGETVTLTASPTGANYDTEWWINNQLYSTNDVIYLTPSDTTTVKLIVEENQIDCIDSTTFTINVLPSPTADAGEDQTICLGQSATLTGSGGGSYLWSTSSTNSSITVTPTQATTYTLQVTNEYGCTDIDTVAIFVCDTVLNISGCLDEDVSLTLSYGCSGKVYYWSFGDSTFTYGAGSGVNHTYANPGFYNIIITDTADNTCSHTEIVYIKPSLAGYNENHCVCNYDNYTDEGIILIDSDETWSSNRRINGTVRITNNATLTINNSAEIGFSPTSKIIVEAGANLEVNSATLTGINYGIVNGVSGVCGSSVMIMMWMGIEVWGVTSNTAQNPSVQGEVRLNGATISNAHNAIIAGKTLLTVDPNNLAKFVFNSHDETANGGIISAYNSTFNQNARSIFVWDFPNNFRSEVNQCLFTSEILSSNTYQYLKDPYYGYKSPFYYEKQSGGIYGFYHNPHFPRCFETITSTSNFRSSRNHINLIGVKNRFIIKNSTFENAFCAINSENSKAYIGYIDYPNTFSNNIWGVRIEESTTVGGVTVEGNTFYLNSAANQYQPDNQLAIKCQSAHNNYIIHNNFDGFNRDYYTNAYPLGVAENNSYYYTIRDNYFFEFDDGIKLNDNGTTASSIYNNNFDECYINVETGAKDSSGYIVENNHGVQIKCNQKINSQPDYYIDNWQTQGYLNHQGVNGPSTNDPAGNYFDATSRKHINNKDTNRNYTYYHHSDTLNYRPTDRSARIPVNLFNTGIGINDSTCVEIDTTGEGGESMERSLALLDAEYTQLESDKQALESRINPSQTFAILQGIQTTTNLSSMGNWLLAASPLADTVLISIAESKKELGNELFKQIMIANAPFSHKVFIHVQNKLNRLPAQVRKPIEDAQLRNSKNTITGINRQLHAVNVKKGNYTRKLLNTYLKKDSLAKVIEVLKKEKSSEAKQLLIGEYVELKDFNNARNLLAELQGNSTEMIAYKELNTLLIDLEAAGKTIWNLNEMQYAKVFEIANYCPAGLATYQAQAILRNAYGIIIPECEYLNNSLNNSVVARIASEKEKVNYLPEQNSSPQTLLGDNLPNPATNTTLIPFLLDKNQKNAYICISDLSGKMLKRYAINSEQTSIEVDLSDFESGMYIYCLQIDNKLHSSKRFNIIK